MTQTRLGAHLLSLPMVLAIAFVVAGCAFLVSERSRTEEYLRVAVEEFPTGQGPAGFDEVPQGAPPPALAIRERPLSGPEPPQWYEPRRTVRAKAPSGSEYEAYCGYADSDSPTPSGQLSRTTVRTLRQSYGTHHGATYYPESVFIGKRVGGLLKPILVFPDVGSHTTAPHALAIDNQERCHLAVADVNIFQDNALDLYWLVEDLQTGRWLKAWLLEKRGFTSWAHPRSLAWGESIHLLWNCWSAANDDSAAKSGLFYVGWAPGGFTRKVRIASGEIGAWDIAVGSESGLLLAACALDDGVYAVTRSRDGTWSRHGLIQTGRVFGLSVDARPGVFIVRTASKVTREFELALPELPAV